MNRNYPLHQCGLYAIGSKRRLAQRLCRSEGFILARAGKPDLYKVWDEPKSSGGTRCIEAPRPDLKEIQRRIADLLHRVLPPEFLFCPVKGRSYIDNAVAHRFANEVRLLDVVNYFGNCTDRSIFTFFHRELKCAPDIAWLLAGLTTREGHLPQGSPCSPILSFYSCKPMWDTIAQAVKKAGCELTVYVDDITISGPMVPEALIWEVKQTLYRFGHRHHKGKERRHANRPAEVTGIIVFGGRVRVPHRHYKKLQAARLEARKANDAQVKEKMAARARSLEAQVQHLNTI